MRSWFGGLMAAAFAALVALLLVPGPSSAADVVPTAPANYAYDAQPHTAAPTHSTSERGPPGAYDQAIAHGAVDHWSRGTSARPDGTASRAAITYDHPVLVAREAGMASPTQGPGQVAVADFLALGRECCRKDSGRLAGSQRDRP